MPDQEEVKRKERKALWIGIGTILAVLFLVIGILTLIFGGKEKPKQAKKEVKPIKKETVAPVKQPEPAPKPEEKVAEETQEPERDAETYEVQPGDTLFAIGLNFNIDWHRIAEVNQLEQDAVLKPGDKLIIPAE